MERMGRIGIAATSMVVALGIWAAAAMPASAREFAASKAGKTSSTATTNQIFNTGSGSFECSKAVGNGEVKEGELRSEIRKEAITYSQCAFFGFVKVKFNAWHWKFDADGTGELEDEVTFTPEGAGCTIKFPGKQVLKSVIYANEEGGIHHTFELEGLHSRGSGGSCGGENVNGTLEGTLLSKLEGGTLEWR